MRTLWRQIGTRGSGDSTWDAWQRPHNSPLPSGEAASYRAVRALSWGGANPSPARFLATSPGGRGVQAAVLRSERKASGAERASADEGWAPAEGGSWRLVLTGRVFKVSGVRCRVSGVGCQGGSVLEQYCN